MNDFSLRTSHPRRVFKSLLGQANHFLITQLVGLAAVESGKAECPLGLSAAWNPQSRKRSAERSREFAIRGALTSACDALDAYVRLINREPFTLEDPELRRSLDAKGRNYLEHRLRSVALQSPSQSMPLSLALVCLAVGWRNRLVHYVAEGDLSDDLRSTLLAHSEAIASSYQGLSATMLLSHFDSCRRVSTPTLKEVAALIRASHEYVSAVDIALLQELDGKRYFHGWLATFTKGRDDRVLATWGKDPRSRLKRLETLAREAGFSSEPPIGLCVLKYEDIEATAEWSVVTARTTLRSHVTIEPIQPFHSVD